MKKQQHRRNLWQLAALSLGVFGSSGCRGSSLWTVAAPVNEVTESALNSPTGAQQAFVGAAWELTAALFSTTGFNVGNNYTDGGVILPAELLSDEYTQQYCCANFSTDARITSAEEPKNNDEYSNDQALSALLSARSSLLVTVPYLAANEQPPNQSLTGQALALAGYAEVFMAEDYCAGVPLTQAVTGGGLAFGQPLTTDSLLGVAEQHFRQALNNSYPSEGDTTVFYLASVGLGRTLVDRGRFDTAAGVVTNVPLGFVYNLYGQSQENGAVSQLYWTLLSNLPSYGWGGPIIANNEGGVGNNFVSSADPRLLLAPVGQTSDGWNQDNYQPGTQFPDTLILWPVKFGSTPATFTALPLATGIEARLIAAEDSFWHGGQGANVYPYLNTLRQAASQTYIQATGPVPMFMGDTAMATCGGSGDTLCAKVLFHERAFWLFGLGNRLGDMRREERQYGLVDTQVFPHGPYLRDSTDSAYLANTYGHGLVPPWPTYGTDVSLSLPTAASGETTINPNYKTEGCLAPATTETP